MADDAEPNGDLCLLTSCVAWCQGSVNLSTHRHPSVPASPVEKIITFFPLFNCLDVLVKHLLAIDVYVSASHGVPLSEELKAHDSPFPLCIYQSLILLMTHHLPCVWISHWSCWLWCSFLRASTWRHSPILPSSVESPHSHLELSFERGHFRHLCLM